MTSHATPVLELREAGVRYGERWIWRHVSLAVEPGEFVVVVGPNGAGKSTLLRVLLGFTPLSAGTAKLLGEDSRRARSAAGYLPQHRSIDSTFSIRGRDLVRFGVDGSHWGMPLFYSESDIRALVGSAIEAVGARSFADARIADLSGGEAQRLFLAQALVGRPKVLFLDEPLANLDLRNQAALVSLITRLRREHQFAVVLVAHNLNVLLSAIDRVIYVANERMAIGSPDEVITTETLSRLYGAHVEVLRDSRGHLFIAEPEVVA